tara:strand:- start:1542 stop:2195 length:654 start_codon:yes stop_codon:yes gene_type:complete
MCGRYIQTNKTKFIKKIFNLKSPFNDDLISYNISPSNYSLIIINNKSLCLEKAKWGFSFYDKSTSVNKNVINSRIETINSKLLFKDSFNLRKCVIPANGYYEWKIHKNNKIPFYINIPEQESIYFAGIWKYLNFKENLNKIFTIITKKANSKIMNIHNRMPILLSRDETEKYLYDDKSSYLNLNFTSELEDYLDFYSVSKFVNNPLNDSRECIKYFN